MEKVVYPVGHIVNEKEKKSFLLLSPILLGSAIYAGSISIMIFSNIVNILF